MKPPAGYLPLTRHVHAVNSGLQNLILQPLNIYFRKIQYSGSIPGDPVAVFISNHRNGAIDGYFLKRMIPRPIFISNKELSPFIRFLGGDQITVYRHPENPKQRKFNHSQLRMAVDLAIQGKSIVIFPEGTSKLGPTLLPLKKGVAWILKELVSSAGSIRCAPVGLHYERGYEFRSAVEVFFGPVQTLQYDNTRNLDLLMDSIKSMLLQVSVNFPDRDEQRRGELFADFVSHYRKDISHRELCRLYAENRIPESIINRFLTIYNRLPDQTRPPVFFENGPVTEVLWGLLLTVFVMTAFLLNIIPCSAAYLAAKFMADDDNVISLWRTLAGVPILLFQLIAYAVFFPIYFGLYAGVFALGGYLLISAIGIAGFHRWRTILRKIRNHRYCTSQGMKYLLNEILLWPVK